MNLLTADSISKSYADRPILENIRFSIEEGHKIGVIGINGAGKSTLLRLVAGLELPDSGQIIRSRGLAIEYLPQLPTFSPDATILEAVLHGQSPLMQLVREYEMAADDLADQPDDPLLQKRLIQLSARMDDANAWNLDSDAKTMLNRLGITDLRLPVRALSGGQKKRIALAAALINPADLLILDEPTNHIDAQAIDWIEQYLKSYQGALLMVTHDRYFLERVTDILFEIDRTSLFRYEAHYSQWLEQKAERIEQEQASEQKRQNLLRRELAWIRRGAKARSTKQKARINRFNDLQGQETQSQAQTVRFSAASTRLGKKILVLDHVSKRYPDQLLFDDFSYLVSRRERLGLIGPNGSGKTTLLKIMAGVLTPDTGTREAGATVKIGFFTQENDPVDPDQRVIDAVRETAEVVRTDDGEVTAAQMLERFLFPPALQWTQIQKLSGGERRRLQLLKVLMGAPNVLLLDEPTNDLDIATLSVLEDYLEEFPGAVIVVSHDRYFLDRVVDRILDLEKDGHISQYEGNYQAYLEQAKKRTDQITDESTAKSAGTPDRPTGNGEADPARTPPDAAPRLRLKMSEKLELETIDQRVADLEEQIASTQNQLDESVTDYVRLTELSAKMQALQAEYEAATERWVYLNDLVERIEQQKQGV